MTIEMLSVLNKKQNYVLWQSGAFGNKLRAWRTIAEWSSAGYLGKVALRIVGVGCGPCRYNLEPNEVEDEALLWVARGIRRDQIMVNEMGPDDAVILQGEYLNDIYTIDGEVRWGCFFHSWHGTPMRNALRVAPREAHSLRADLILSQTMTPASHEDWETLIAKYPGHVLEVSIYDRCLGDIPGRNAVVWEVRRY